MKDKEMIQDLLGSEQALASACLTAVVSSSCPIMQDTLSQLLSNTLQNVQMIGQEMQSYNWTNPAYGAPSDLEQLQFQYQMKVEQLETSLKQVKMKMNQ